MSGPKREPQLPRRPEDDETLVLCKGEEGIIRAVTLRREENFL